MDLPQYLIDWYRDQLNKNLDQVEAPTEAPSELNTTPWVGKFGQSEQLMPGDDYETKSELDLFRDEKLADEYNKLTKKNKFENVLGNTIQPRRSEEQVIKEATKTADTIADKVRENQDQIAKGWAVKPNSEYNKFLQKRQEAEEARLQEEEAPNRELSSDEEQIQETPEVDLEEDTSTTEENNAIIKNIFNEINKRNAKKASVKADFNKMLIESIKNKDYAKLSAALGKAGETLGSAISGMVNKGIVTKQTGTEFYNQLAKDAADKPEEVVGLMAMDAKQSALDLEARKSDPDSEESQFSREVLKQQGIDVPDNATAAALEKYVPYLAKFSLAKQMSDIRKEEKQTIATAKKQEKEKAEKEKAITSARDQVQTKGNKLAFELLTQADNISQNLQNLSPDMYGDSIRTLQSAKLFQGDTSVVRGPELKEIQNAVGVLDRFKNEVNRLGGVSKLQEKQRQAILNAALTIRNVAKNAYVRTVTPAAKQFYRRGLPLDEIFDPNILPSLEEMLYNKPSGSSEKMEDTSERADVQAYADDFFKGDYKKAYQYLKNKGKL